MSINSPDDTEKVLNALIKSAERAAEYLPLHIKLLLHGALIDAKDLLAEIQGKERIDTHEEALKTLRSEIKKVVGQ